MAGIGDDIKEVLDELGTTATITKSDTSTVTEKIDPEAYPTHSSEFIRQFFISATFNYETVAVIGDDISFRSKHHILVNIDESTFEDLPVDKIGSMYLCNTNGAFKRETTTVNPTTFAEEKTWAVASGNPASLYALQYENKFGFEQMFAEDMQSFFTEKHILVIPNGLDVKVGDRWYPNYQDDTVYFRISAIESRRLGTPICTLDEDTR